MNCHELPRNEPGVGQASIPAGSTPERMSENPRQSNPARSEGGSSSFN